MAICKGYGFQSIVHFRISKVKSFFVNYGAVTGITALNVSGLIQEAADCANKLKNYNAFYYSALYERNLEMMYLFIEPLISSSPYLNPLLMSDDEIVAMISKLVR